MIHYQAFSVGKGYDQLMVEMLTKVILMIH